MSPRSTPRPTDPDAALRPGGGRRPAGSELRTRVPRFHGWRPGPATV